MAHKASPDSYLRPAQVRDLSIDRNGRWHISLGFCIFLSWITIRKNQGIAMQLKHSGPGIASFVTSILSGIALFITFIVAGTLETTTPGGMDENSMEAVLVGLMIIFMMLVCLVSLGLGIGGLVQKDRQKIFAILGTTFSGLIILGTIGLIALGMSMG
ncbi:hypothetical protein [Shewanella algae]|uniref:hypothetical protein n=1 Tax=Shewanella algae TaxID=38313 RepID=UPI001FBB7F70|nr:hypothetical protein [Shewanella algae]